MATPAAAAVPASTLSMTPSQALALLQTDLGLTDAELAAALGAARWPDAAGDTLAHGAGSTSSQARRTPSGRGSAATFRSAGTQDGLRSASMTVPVGWSGRRSGGTVTS